MHAELDQHLRALAPALPAWFIVTAFNPHGRLQSMRCNRHAHARLSARLENKVQNLVLPTCHRDPSGQWPDEPGWLVACSDPHDGVALAREFDQLAIVAGCQHRAAELWLCDGQWPATLPRHVRVAGS
ncbi:MAG: DUF3293 domain-containing protein [Wenzhouxiangellaceae bacterium]|nr:DUF3293 domain-containing protein [Wenzhouxiangellaceae bacterium]